MQIDPHPFGQHFWPWAHIESDQHEFGWIIQIPMMPDVSGHLPWLMTWLSTGDWHVWPHPLLHLN